MIRGTSKSTTSVPQIQRFDSLETSSHSPTGPPRMSLEKCILIMVYMCHMTHHFNQLLFAKVIMLDKLRCIRPRVVQVIIFACSLRYFDEIWLFAVMSLKSTLGVLLNWFLLLGTFHRVLHWICLYPTHTSPRCPPLSTAKTTPPPSSPNGAKNVGGFQPVCGI